MKLCKGSVTHGTGCNVCASCEKEREKLQAMRPVSLLVTEDDLDHWAAIADDIQFQEIIRLARHGLWSERFHGAIHNALKAATDRESVAKVTPAERALDAYRNIKRRAN